MRIALTAAALAGTWLAAAEPPRFTLEQVMDAPFASELTVAPKGGRIAWVFNIRGARNIWLAEAPGYQARRLTAYAGDDGQELTSLTWTPDGLSIVFVRGGEANPLSDPQGSEQALWIVPAAGGAPPG